MLLRTQNQYHFYSSITHSLKKCTTSPYRRRYWKPSGRGGESVWMDEVMGFGFLHSTTEIIRWCESIQCSRPNKRPLKRVHKMGIGLLHFADLRKSRHVFLYDSLTNGLTKSLWSFCDLFFANFVPKPMFKFMNQSNMPIGNDHAFDTPQ